MSTDFSAITVENILLVGCHLSFLGSSEQPAYNLGLTALSRRLEQDGKKLLVRAEFDLMEGLEKPACEMRCAFVAIYGSTADEDIDWSGFSDGHALAHMLPFVREFISNVTNRMPLPPLMIPPVNTFNLVAAFREREAAEKKPSPQIPST